MTFVDFLLCSASSVLLSVAGKIKADSVSISKETEGIFVEKGVLKKIPFPKRVAGVPNLLNSAVIFDIFLNINVIFD